MWRGFPSQTEEEGKAYLDLENLRSDLGVA